MWTMGPEDRKRVKILKLVLGEDLICMPLLRRLALVGGLVSKELRRQAWPKLLGIHPFRDRVDYDPKGAPAQCRDHDQVAKDVERSLWRWVPQREIMNRRQQLSRLLNWALAEDCALYYYQGLHDVGSVLLLTCGEAAAAPLLRHMMRHHLREYLHCRIDGVEHVLQLMPPILRAEDPPLHRFLCDADVGDRCHFALAWVLTWFAHPLDGELNSIARLFDAFLAAHPLLPMYLSVAVVLHRRTEILREPCQFPEVHSLLTKVPPQLPWDTLLVRAAQLMKKHPPADLWRKTQASLKIPTPTWLEYPYPHLREPQHSERYWLLHATPAERAGIMPINDYVREDKAPMNVSIVATIKRLVACLHRPRRWVVFAVLAAGWAVVTAVWGPNSFPPPRFLTFLARFVSFL